MMSFHSLIKQIFISKKILRYVFIACIPALLFYAASLIILCSHDFKIMEVIRDTAQLTRKSSFLGFLSNIGVWLWVSSVAISSFGCATCKSPSKDRHKELLFTVGLMSLTLAVDDFFMIHDRYVDQDICYTVYAFLAIALLLRHFKRIIEIEGFAFLLAGFLLALSILTDLIQKDIPLMYKHVQIIEEGFKFVGTATWLYFCCRIASFDTSERPVTGNCMPK